MASVRRARLTASERCRSLEHAESLESTVAAGSAAGEEGSGVGAVESLGGRCDAERR